MESTNLRERFKQPLPETGSVPVQPILELIGIKSSEMVETIIGDLKGMLEKNLLNSMEGYVLCLSRIIKHDLAWRCICQSFSDLNREIPDKYFKLFGQQNITKIPYSGLKVS